VPPTKAGGGKYEIGYSARALFIYTFQIRAGKVPPVMEFNPPIPVSCFCGVSRKNATAVAKSGEYPLNQAEALS
jgi:hypothetical protein